jgi:carboxyl-terminal processing protease
MTPATPLRAIAALVFILAWAVGALAQPITAQEKDDVLQAVERIITQRAYVPGVDLSAWPDKLREHRDKVDAADSHPAFARAVNQALRDFGVSHMRLRTPQAREARLTSTTVGVGVQARPENDALTITDVMPDSPAAAVGLEPGDRITHVDGEPADAAAELQGQEGAPVRLRLLRAGAEEPIEVTILRERLSTVRPETLTWHDEQTPVLKVWTFSGEYDRQNVEKLLRLSADAPCLILDLRSNGGGQLRNLLHLMNLLTPSGTVVGTPLSKQVPLRTRDDPDADGAAEPDLAAMAASSPRRLVTSERSLKPFAGRIAVLVNRGSASCSEIAAAALQESVGALIVGSPTAGAVLFSSFARLPHGFEIQYPGADFVTASGRRLEANPIRPDAYAPSPRRDQPDAGVRLAAELLRRREAPVPADAEHTPAEHAPDGKEGP